MPNGEFVGQIPLPVPDVELEVPGVPAEATSFSRLAETIGNFLGGLFGGGGSGFRVVQTEAQAQARQAEFQERLATTPIFPTGQRIIGTTAVPSTSPVTGRVSIPTPEQGGPELVTERFRNLPPIPMVPDLVEGPLGFEGIEPTMPVDVPLLAGVQSFLPAVRTVAQPTLQGVVGGLAGGFLSEFLRAPQELGMAQVPARQPVGQLTGCPVEKPHTRILRFIKQNTGVSINLSRAKSLIRELGLENAARCLGITAAEVCSLLIVASPRRRRGISASDIRIVKRTARRFENLKHALGRPGHHHHRRRHTRHAHK